MADPKDNEPQGGPTDGTVGNRDPRDTGAIGQPGKGTVPDRYPPKQPKSDGK